MRHRRPTGIANRGVAPAAGASRGRGRHAGEFLTRCVEATGHDITDMVEAAVDIPWAEFWQTVDRDATHVMLGYDATRLTLERDWAVPLPCRSTYQGAPCVFLTWSGIEYVFAAAPREEDSRTE